MTSLYGSLRDQGRKLWWKWGPGIIILGVVVVFVGFFWGLIAYGNRSHDLCRKLQPVSGLELTGMGNECTYWYPSETVAAEIGRWKSAKRGTYYTVTVHKDRTYRTEFRTQERAEEYLADMFR
jgi:hypothetical protein